MSLYPPRNNGKQVEKKVKRRLMFSLAKLMQLINSSKPEKAIRVVVTKCDEIATWSREALVFFFLLSSVPFSKTGQDGGKSF
jgi:hypothetical protein